MTPQALESWITLGIQVPLVGLFIYFSITMIDKFLKSIDVLSKIFAETVTSITKTYTDSDDKRDTSWREFMNQQREANAVATSNMAIRFSDEIRALGKEIAELRGLSK